MSNQVNLVEFTDRYGKRCMVNTHHVLALYPNGIEDELTFIETAPEGVTDATGTIVVGTLDEVKAKLEAN